MSLNHQDVQQILQILDDSPYDELSLTLGTTQLTLRRTADGGSWQQELSEAAQPQVLHAQQPADASAAADAAAASQDEPAASEAGLLDVRAPMVGTWYQSPKPGAEPFISVGSRVEENTVIGIIEVMKLMSSIPAGVSGTVAEILMDDASFVGKGQLLIRVRPDAT